MMGSRPEGVVHTQTGREIEINTRRPQHVFARAAGQRIDDDVTADMCGCKLAHPPADNMHLRHDFWSIRDHSTYRLPAGRDFLSRRRQSIKDIPVAIGRTKQLWQETSPMCRNASNTSALVRLDKIVDPMALGCGSETFPERPIPWLNW